MNERIKELRKVLNLTQQEFANRIHVSRGALAVYEIGRNEPIDAVISLICREFNVNETWLRTGNGKMFVEPSSFNLEEFAKQRGATEFEVQIVKKYFELPASIRQTLVEHFKRGIWEESAAPSAEQTQPDIVAELAEFKRQNREMAAKMAAMEEELALLEAEEGYNALPSVSNGNFSAKK